METDLYQRWLEELLVAQGGVAGTVHLRREGELELVAAHNIPPQVVEVVRRVPRGKGMAGLALLRAQPVQSCNIQTDSSGQVKPGARAVKAQASVALPVLEPTGEVRAVVGIGFAAEGEIPPDREQALLAATARLPRG